jgi:hypothetical protein
MKVWLYIPPARRRRGRKYRLVTRRKARRIILARRG